MIDQGRDFEPYRLTVYKVFTVFWDTYDVDNLFKLCDLPLDPVSAACREMPSPLASAVGKIRPCSYSHHRTET
jgi:hypothetical protein